MWYCVYNSTKYFSGWQLKDLCSQMSQWPLKKFAKGNARSTLKQEFTYNQKLDSWPDTKVVNFDFPLECLCYTTA